MTGILIFIGVAVGVAILIAVVVKRPPGSAERSDVDPDPHNRPPER